MITLNDIKKVVEQFGEEVVDNPKRMYAILADWHPRERIVPEEVEKLCQQWKEMKQAFRHIHFEGPFRGPFGEPFDGPFELPLEDMITLYQRKKLEGEIPDMHIHTKQNGKTTEVKMGPKGMRIKKTTTNGETTDIKMGANGMQIKKTTKAGINTKTILIHIDTSQSFRK